MKKILSIFALLVMLGFLAPGTTALGHSQEKIRERHQKELEKIEKREAKAIQKFDAFLQKHIHALASAADDGDDDDDEKRHRRMGPCTLVPAGEVVRPDLVRQHGGLRPVVLLCRGEEVRHNILRRLVGRVIGFPTSTPDVIPPVISNVEHSSLATSSARISWITNESSTSKVYYGVTTPLHLGTASTTVENALVHLHDVALTNLFASSTYYYVVESSDALGNTATSSEKSFRTLGL